MVSGVFLIIATLIIVVAPKFFEHRDTYYISYRGISLTGLQEGSAVKYHGLTVGYVSDIFIDVKDIERVIVRVSLDRGIPIKEDTYADIELLGITGLKIIELRGGTNESKPLKPGDYIRSGQSTAEMITGKAEIMMDKAEVTLNNLALLTNPENQKKLNTLLDNTSTSMAILSKLLSENQTQLENTFANSEKVTLDLKELMLTLNNTMLEINRIVSSDSVHQIIDNIANISENIRQADLAKLVQELNTALSATNNILQAMDVNINQTWVNFSASIESIRETAQYLDQFSRMITEDPSLLLRGTKPGNVPDKKLED